MWLSELHGLDTPFKLEKDGEFDSIYLAGRNCNADKKNISFIISEKYIRSVIDANVDCIICPNEILEAVLEFHDGGICVTEDPKSLLFEIHKVLTKCKTQKETRISSTAVIHESARIADYNVVIGEHVVIGANTVIHENVIIGDSVTIMENCVIGTPSFYYYGNGDQRKMVANSGNVIIKDNVTLHVGVVIETGVIGGSTVLGRNSKIDHTVVISHDVSIGENCTIAANVSLSGWVTVGEETFIGMSAAVAPAVRIGKYCSVSIGAVVTLDVSDKQRVTGNLAIEHGKHIDHLKEIVN